MRISDWSSDVCSSDLVAQERVVGREIQRIEVSARVAQHRRRQPGRIEGGDLGTGGQQVADVIGRPTHVEAGDHNLIGSACWRDRVMQYVSISVASVALKHTTLYNITINKHHVF